MFKSTVRWLIYFIVLIVVLMGAAGFWFFKDALYSHYFVFPQQAQAWANIRAQHQQPVLKNTLSDYRGVLHTHSYISHDSEVTYEHILASAKIANMDFLFVSDHCANGVFDNSLGWRGVYDNVLFVPGHEGPHGLLSWMPDNKILDCNAAAEVQAQDIVDSGGILLYSHSEGSRMWDNPNYTGMEIYNIHTDMDDESYTDLVPKALLSSAAYPDQAMRTLFDRQTPILQHWDALNQQRQIVGFAAVDAHQNNGIRGYYTADDSLLLKETSPRVIGEWPLNFFSRMLLQLVFGELEPGKQLFRYNVDPYERSLRFVNNHVLSESLDELNITQAIKKGRLFIAFDMIADARGFVFQAQAGDRVILLGETQVFEPGTVVHAASPYPVRFTLMRNGELVARGEGREFSYALEQAGNYRIEAELNVLDEWLPWVYTNPIYLTVSE